MTSPFGNATHTDRHTRDECLISTVHYIHLVDIIMLAAATNTMMFIMLSSWQKHCY